MDLNTQINGLAHELWAIAQGKAPIDDVVTPMMAELEIFADAIAKQNQKHPLTDDQINDIYLSISSLRGWDLITALVRKVERFYGIT